MNFHAKIPFRSVIIDILCAKIEIFQMILARKFKIYFIFGAKIKTDFKTGSTKIEFS